MRKLKKAIVILFSILLFSLGVMPVFNSTNAKAQEARFVDQKVLAAQKWLNENYTGKYIYISLLQKMGVLEIRL